MELLEIWREAIRLEDAWIVLSDQSQRDGMRYAKTLQQNSAYERSMKAELVARLLDSQLSAIGIQTAPNPTTEPTMLPSQLFVRPAIDWDRGTVRALGHTFEAVRVVRPEHLRDVVASPPTRAKRRGRRPVSEELANVVRELKEKNQLDGISQKEQETRVRSLARTRYPNLFRTPNQPSRIPIVKALKALGF